VDGRFQRALRDIFDPEFRNQVIKLDDAGKTPPDSVFQKLGQSGILACRLGPGPWLRHIQLPGGVRPEEFDYFHELIAHEEMAALGCPGAIDGLGTGLVIGLPPVMLFGRDELKMRVAQECLSGQKKICLAISEPFAGSDVAGLRCTATKSADGQHYIVNGVKKWITNGTFSDYFVTAVRTGDKGMGGLSLLLIERGPGVTTKPIKTSYSPAAGTALVILEDVKVPIGNLLGKENKGFMCIMANFNHERWVIAAMVIRLARLMLEETFKWCTQRRVFGKPLVSQPVVRNKLADMTAALESVQFWLDGITYQMNNMTYKEQTKQLAGPIALLKYQATRVMYQVNDHAVQLLGGRSLTQTGMGKIVEKLARGVKFAAVYGGSEEIMADLGIKQTLRNYPILGQSKL